MYDQASLQLYERDCKTYSVLLCADFSKKWLSTPLKKDATYDSDLRFLWGE